MAFSALILAAWRRRGEYAGTPMDNRLTPAELVALRAIESPTIANAIEYFEVRPRVSGYCGTNVRSLTPGLGTMLGYAVTCHGDSTTEDKNRREHTDLYRAIFALQPLPVVVVIGMQRLFVKGLVETEK